ncbi:leucine-rich repeat-containing protein 40 [Polyergus mexicanus]|uniref:leucine-rich repeat-containing protein 40 n=1 Tax=Polyergus mexicanus TaxID=615972 RepID=UPI0038B42E06
MFNYCNIIMLFLLIVRNKCLCDICKTCICSTLNTGAIIDCHNKHLGVNDVLNFDLFTLDQHQPLNKLILSKNNIVLLPINELKNLKHLKKLDLSQNQLDNIHLDIFKNLNDLEDLNYSHNLLWGFDISILNIDSSLSKFNLSHNRINSMERSSENTTIKLKVLDVSHNNLTNLNFLDGLPQLKYLDLSFNKLTILPTKSLFCLQHLKILYINNNHLLDLNLQNFPLSLLELYAGNNFINHLLLQKSSIRILNIQNNRIPDISKNLTLLEGLKDLNINRNSLSGFPDVFLKDLEILDLSFNNLRMIPETVSIKNFPNLRILKVNKNRLKDIKIRSELRLERLEVNFVETIKEISKEAFLMLREKENDCINITISSNKKLSTIEKNVFQHMNICFLDLSNNCFAHLPSELFDVNVNYLINLQGNPFICNCSLQWMLNIIVPKLYLMKPSLLEDLRCAGPSPLTNKRMIHWYKWKGKVFCDDFSHLAERMTVNIASIFDKQVVTFETSPGMIAALATAITLLAILTIIGILLTQRMIAKKRRINRKF